MIVEEKKLAEEVGCKHFTLRQYLCRSEFAHIDRQMFKGTKSHSRIWIYNNVEESDIKRLKELIRWKTKRQNKNLLAVKLPTV